MYILGIETSCDETSAAVLFVKNNKYELRSLVVHSQIDIHRQYGGVVPEVAARSHVQHIVPVIEQAITRAKIKSAQLDRIAVATGPGLISSLLVGAQAAQVLAYSWKKPIVSVDHVKAHLHACWLANQPISLPAIGLIVSGGHTELVLIKDQTHIRKIGQTLDDAAGEAFDKVAQLLNLGYPGGPIIGQRAEQGNADAFKLPRPLVDRSDFNFSFAGLKTAVLYAIKKLPTPLASQQVNDMAASFQQAAIDCLVKKTIAAVTTHKPKSVLLAGGVAANLALREQLTKAVKTYNIQLHIPPMTLCTDNAAMIAAAGYIGTPVSWQKIKIDPNRQI